MQLLRNQNVGMKDFIFMIKILVVDKDLELLDFMSEELTDFEVKIASYCNCVMGLLSEDKFIPDMVTSDSDLGEGFNGIDVLNFFRKRRYG